MLSRHLIAALALCAAALQAKPSGYLELEGGAFGKRELGAKSGPEQQSLAFLSNWKNEGENALSMKVRFPSRGVWYVWLKVSSGGPLPAVLTYDLDGVQYLKGSRREIMVQPWAKGTWLSHTRYAPKKIEVHAGEAGDHVLRFTQVQGEARVEKVLLTLYYSAKLDGDALDMSGDPGHGRMDFPQSPVSGGFRKNWKSPAIHTKGRRFYVDPDKGDDKADGLNPRTAWKSLEKANAAVFQPGEALLLKRGARFEEGLAPKGSGSPSAWITVGAYGEGRRPVVNGVNKPGLSLRNQEYWVVQDLELTSDPEYKQDGLSAEAVKDGPRVKGLKVYNCLAYDNGGHGFHVGEYKGYDGVLLENCLSFDNYIDGIVCGGTEQKGSARNMAVRYCTAYSNPGMAGIWIASAENGLIEDCVAYNNACVNIWAWNACNITMRRCETFRGRPPRDAAGFDIDWGSEACTLEYCYSHHNEGDAFLLMGSGNLKYLGYTMQSNYNLVRYNVAEGHAGFDMGETFNHSKVHNNLSMVSGKDSHAFSVFGWPNNAKGGDGGWPENTEVFNNVFFGLDGAGAMLVDGPAIAQGNLFDHNLLHSQSGVLMRWGGQKNGPLFWKGDPTVGSSPPREFPSLSAAQAATGLFKNSLQGDPLLVKPATGAYGRLPLKDARLKAGSPAFGKGAPVTLSEAWLKGRAEFLTETGAGDWGIPMQPAQATHDYWGAKLDLGKISIGAQQAP